MEDPNKKLKEIIRRLMVDNGHSADEIIEGLKQKNIPHEIATSLVYEVSAEHKDAIIEKRNSAEKKEGLETLAYIGVLMVSSLGPIAHIEEPAWSWIAPLICAVIAYFTIPQKPIAAIVGAIIFCCAFSYAYEMYFKDRSSYIKIEMAIPMLMAGVPAFAMFKLLEALIYPHED